jgi:hypothetical protein
VIERVENKPAEPATEIQNVAVSEVLIIDESSGVAWSSV